MCPDMTGSNDRFRWPKPMNRNSQESCLRGRWSV